VTVITTRRPSSSCTFASRTSLMKNLQPRQMAGFFVGLTRRRDTSAGIAAS
jgi:hypothetical protein